MRRLCAQSGCPSLVAENCRVWLTEVERSVPTVVFGARDFEGNEVFDVRVVIDDARAIERLDGHPVSLDPGSHRIRFERTGHPPVAQTVVAREGKSSGFLCARSGTRPASPQQVQHPGG